MSRQTRLFKPPGVTVSFKKSLGDTGDTIAFVIDVLTSLSPVLRPLALDLEIGSCILGTRVFDDSVAPRQRDAFIRESISPPHVDLEPSYVSEDHVFVVPDLNPPVVDDWLKDSLRQEQPDERHISDLQYLWCRFARARLLTADNDLGLTVVDRGGNSWPAPILERDEGLWVPGPLNYRPMDAPLSFSIHDLDGLVSARLQIGWELWIAEDQPERQLLMECLHTILDRGWRSDSEFFRRQ